MWTNFPLVFQMKPFSLIVLTRGDCIQVTAMCKAIKVQAGRPKTPEGKDKQARHPDAQVKRITKCLGLGRSLHGLGKVRRGFYVISFALVFNAPHFFCPSCP